MIKRYDLSESLIEIFLRDNESVIHHEYQNRAYTQDLKNYNSIVKLNEPLELLYLNKNYSDDELDNLYKNAIIIALRNALVSLKLTKDFSIKDLPKLLTLVDAYYHVKLSKENLITAQGEWDYLSDPFGILLDREFNNLIKFCVSIGESQFLTKHINNLREYTTSVIQTTFLISKLTSLYSIQKKHSSEILRLTAYKLDEEYFEIYGFSFLSFVSYSDTDFDSRTSNHKIQFVGKLSTKVIDSKKDELLKSIKDILSILSTKMLTDKLDKLSELLFEHLNDIKIYLIYAPIVGDMLMKYPVVSTEVFTTGYLSFYTASKNLAEEAYTYLNENYDLNLQINSNN